METIETTETSSVTKEQMVPAVRSDSVVAYLSNLSAALTSIAADLNKQIANITAGMETNKETV
jgi:hypothetical protein